jgi:hypothetical protein
MSDEEVINYSEMSTLARCEMQYVYAYKLGVAEAADTNKRGLHRGTLIHLGGDNWLRGEGARLPETWTDDINTGGKPGEMRTLSLSDFDPEDVARARWLLARYEQHYGSRPPSSWNVISSEEWLTTTVTVDGVTYRIVGRTDGLIEIEGMLWLRELKSYGSRGRLKTVHVEPQPTIYKRLVEDNYERELFGVMFDGVYTYEWALKKPTQAQLIEQHIANGGLPFPTKKAAQEWAREEVAHHPGFQEHGPEESFERVFTDRSEVQVELTEKVLAAAIKRRNTLETLDDAIPNVGQQTCNSCGFKARCWARLAGDDESDIEVLDWDPDAELSE